MIFGELRIIHALWTLESIEQKCIDQRGECSERERKEKSHGGGHEIVGLQIRGQVKK